MPDDGTSALLEPDLAAKAALLRDAAIYPERTHRVEAVETHMSWVFLTDRHAYKLKKPVCYGHLDFRMASARQFYCLEELRLNRRLAPRVYLDVVPLARGEDGRLRVAGEGVAVDWLVKMRRLRASAFLDALLRTEEATAAQMRRIAVRLASFYAALQAAPLGPDAYRALLSRHIDENERALCDPAWRLPQARIRTLCRAQRAVLQDAAAMFDARVAAGRVVDGHGDLRPEHVFLGEPLAIIDCLEFSAELRTQDSADELGFLALECERAGAAALGGVLLQSFSEASGDRPPAALLHFYQGCRALSRAGLAIRHLAEPRYRASAQWRQRARECIRLAAAHTRACCAALASMPVIPAAAA